MENNIGLLLAKRAHINPHLEAVVEPSSGRRFSYATLNQRANQIARAVQGKGIEKGDRVALLAMNGSEFVESFFGLAKLGIVVVPLNWRLVPDELAYILKNSGARMLIYSSEFATSVEALNARPPGAIEVEHWVEINAYDPCLAFAEHYETLLQQQSSHKIEVLAKNDDLLFIMYTSGTTGLPKGAVHTHETMLWATLTFSAGAELRFRDRYVLALPLFHVGALLPLMVNVYCGITNVLLKQFDPTLMWEAIEQEGITGTLAVPSKPALLSGATPVPVDRALYGMINREIVVLSQHFNLM